MQRLWITIIVTLALGLVGAIIAGVQYWQFKSAPEDEQQRMIQTMMELASLDQLKSTSQAFVDQLVPAVAKQWSTENYIERLDPQRTSAKELSIVQMYLANVANEYGPMNRYLGAKGDIQLRGENMSDAVVFAEYTVRAVFQNKGEVEFKVSLSKNPGSDQWYLEGFHGL